MTTNQSVADMIVGSLPDIVPVEDLAPAEQLFREARDAGDVQLLNWRPPEAWPEKLAGRDERDAYYAVLGLLARAKKAAAGKLDRMVKAANALHKGLTAIRKEAIAEYDQHDARIRGLVTAWDRDDQKARDDAKAEADGIAAARMADADALRQKAQSLTAAGLVEEAASVHRAAEVAAAPTPQEQALARGAEQRPAEGVRANWQAVLDPDGLRTLVLAIAAGQAPVEAVQLNETYARALAKAFKQKGPLMPGVRCEDVGTLAAPK